jgi:hypothetical protein
MRTAAVAARFGLDWVAVSLDDEPGLNRAPLSPSLCD